MKVICISWLIKKSRETWMSYGGPVHDNGTGPVKLRRRSCQLASMVHMQPPISTMHENKVWIGTPHAHWLLWPLTSTYLQRMVTHSCTSIRWDAPPKQFLPRALENHQHPNWFLAEFLLCVYIPYHRPQLSPWRNASCCSPSWRFSCRRPMPRATLTTSKRGGASPGRYLDHSNNSFGWWGTQGFDTTQGPHRCRSFTRYCFL